MIIPDKILREFRITEKTATLAANLNQYTFEVAPEANRKEIARAVEKLFNVEVDPNLSELPYEKIIAGIRKRADHLVKDFMIPIKATINCDDHIMKAMYEMVEQNTSLLPVLEDGNVVGVVRSVDVLGELALIVSS